MIQKNHSPTLKTIKMVEQAIQECKKSICKIPEIKRNLPKKVNHNTLMQILEYLEESNKIYVNIKGITWIENNSPKLRKAIAEGISWEELQRQS